MYMARMWLPRREAVGDYIGKSPPVPFQRRIINLFTMKACDRRLKWWHRGTKMRRTAQYWWTSIWPRKISWISLSSETMKFALNVITGAGFGVSFTWEASSDEIWPKHTLSFRDAITTTFTSLASLADTPLSILSSAALSRTRQINVMQSTPCTLSHRRTWSITIYLER